MVFTWKIYFTHLPENAQIFHNIWPKNFFSGNLGGTLHPAPVSYAYGYDMLRSIITSISIGLELMSQLQLWP